MPVDENFRRFGQHVNATPCPFCKGDDLQIYDYNRDRKIVKCMRCEAAGPAGHDDGEAVALWNARPPLDFVIEWEVPPDTKDWPYGPYKFTAEVRCTLGNAHAVGTVYARNFPVEDNFRKMLEHALKYDVLMTLYGMKP